LTGQNAAPAPVKWLNRNVLGIGLADLAVAVEVLGRAAARGIGRRLPHPAQALPRLHGGS